jgi:hypothetical protein
MTISPSGSWIWLNGHWRSIRNGLNSWEPVWLCWNWVRNRVNRSKHQFWASGDSLGWTGNILAARLWLTSGSASTGIFFGAAYGLRLGWARLNGSNMARVDGTRLLPLARVGATGLQFPDLQEERVDHLKLRSSWFLRQWVSLDEIYMLEWSKRVFDNSENSDISQKSFCFLTNGALIPIVGGRNHWWWLWNTRRG